MFADIQGNTSPAVSSMRRRLPFAPSVSVRRGGGRGRRAGQHPHRTGLLGEEGAAVAGPLAGGLIGQRRQQRGQQLVVTPSGLLPVQRAAERQQQR